MVQALYLIAGPLAHGPGPMTLVASCNKDAHTYLIVDLIELLISEEQGVIPMMLYTVA